MFTTSSVTKVPLLDLNAQYEPVEERIIAAITEVVRSKQFIMGPQIEQLEEKLAAYCGVKHAIGVSSGTDALVVALMAAGVGAGDEVITSPFTFFATAGSIARVGAVPVFVDIDPRSFNIDPALIEAKISNRTKVIMPVHLFGQMADMDPIMDIATAHNLIVIEDSAQSIGAEYIGRDGVSRRSGSIGHIGCFSFFPSKNLGCCGDGGAVSTNDDVIAERIKRLRVHGGKQRYYHEFVGGNFRLDTIQAAVLLIKLEELETQHLQRIENGKKYNELLVGIPGIQLPIHHTPGRMIYNQYTLRVSDRDAVANALNNANIGNAVYYPLPLHLQECFAHLGHKVGDFPHAELAAKEVISIPIYSELTGAEQDYIASTLRGIG